MSSLPHLVRWNDELSEFGLVILGAHCQNATAEEVQAKAQSKGVNFAVLEGASVKDANDVSGIPHSMLFDHTGKCIYRGTPTGAEAALKSAVGKALVEGLEKAPASKSITPLTDALKKGQSPTLVLQKLIPLQKASDAGAADEAKTLVSKLTEAAQKRVDESEALMKDDPFGAYIKLEKVPLTFKGTPVAVKATALLTELRKDKVVAAELKAKPALDMVKKLDVQLGSLAGKVDPKDPLFQRLGAAPLKQLKTALQTMKKSWPDAKYTQEAMGIGEKYGVTVR